MQKNTVIRNKGPDYTLKVTALLYLKEALDRERYEDCPGLLQAAKEFGAQQGEISKVIAQYIHELKFGRPNEANRFNGRRRFY